MLIHFLDAVYRGQKVAKTAQTAESKNGNSARRFCESSRIFDLFYLKVRKILQRLFFALFGLSKASVFMIFRRNHQIFGNLSKKLCLLIFALFGPVSSGRRFAPCVFQPDNEMSEKVRNSVFPIFPFPRTLPALPIFHSGPKSSEKFQSVTEAFYPANDVHVLVG